MNFFKLYIGDYQRDTAHLSVTEHGAYLLMLQHYYATEKPLPVGKALHRMLRAQDKAERDAIDAIVAQFWTETPDGLVNERADVEITKASAQAETNRAIAQAREAKRKSSRASNEQSTNRATNDQPNQTPDTRHQTNTESNRHTESIRHEAPDDDFNARSLSDDFAPQKWEAWRIWFQDEYGLEHDPYSQQDRSKFRPLAQGWINAKVTVGQMRKAVAKAKAESKEPIAYLPGYVDRVLSAMQMPSNAQFERPLTPAERAAYQASPHICNERVRRLMQAEQAAQNPTNVIDMEANNGTTRLLG